MAIIKCKMCGGDMTLAADNTFGVCQYCGSTMTLPKVDDDQRAAAFNRGNHFRRIGEFDKALAVYERIIQEDDTDAEAHWCCALCRFGIEYVEDPATYEYFPTCHRASFDSILEDVDYLAALEHSGGITRRQYQKDAAKIAEVQRAILASSQNAEPYDVFICYKETDANGERTRDSLMAQDIYYQLTEQGRKVFFARITLEDVVGTQYEPYIFAALNSARVMIVVGTRPEHLNAVWVKNEWSRFLAMMKKDRHKLLLPCYRDMDPYDLPEQLSLLQSYDMGKIGFIQDLTRGISKVLDAVKKSEPVKETVVAQRAIQTSNTESLLKRAFMFLEDGDWDAADEYCEKVLDMDPECASAYLGKLMAELRVSNRSDLKNQNTPFDHRNNYQKVIRFAEHSVKEELTGYIRYIQNRNEQIRLESIYCEAIQKQDAAKTEEEYKAVAVIYGTVSGYRDATERGHRCFVLAEEARKDTIYQKAYALFHGKDVSDIKQAALLYALIPGWKDADAKCTECKEKIVKIETQKAAVLKAIELQAKKNKKIISLTIAAVTTIVVAVLLVAMVIIPNKKYNDAIALLEEGKVLAAYEAFASMDGYKDSAEKATYIYNEYSEAFTKVGDVISFGKYEQDNEVINGKEEIEWIVLEVKDGKALVVSKYALDCNRYHKKLKNITWKDCSIRTWLNNDFFTSAFSEEEKIKISAVEISIDKNPKYNTYAGVATKNKIFLLSIDEVNQYFNSDEARQCKATNYAYAQGVRVDSADRTCEWWLRTLGSSERRAANVNKTGKIDGYGATVNLDNTIAVRPAMWINLKDES